MRDVAPKEGKACAAALGREARKKLIGDDAIVEVTRSASAWQYTARMEEIMRLFPMADRAMYATKRKEKTTIVRGAKKRQEGSRAGGAGAQDWNMPRKRAEGG